MADLPPPGKVTCSIYCGKVHKMPVDGSDSLHKIMSVSFTSSSCRDTSTSLTNILKNQNKYILFFGYL